MSRAPNVRFTIDVDSTTPLVPGSPFTVAVNLITNIPIEVKRVMASLVSRGECRVIDLRYLRRQDRELFPDGSVDDYGQHDFPPLYLSSAEPPLHLHVGKNQNSLSKYMIMSNLNLPRNLVDSWSYKDRFNDAYVTNTLRVNVAYCRIDSQETEELRTEELMTRDATLNIRQTYTVRELEFDRPSMRYLGVRALVGRLRVLKRSLAIGEEVPVEIHIANNSFMFTKRVTLYLCKEYTLWYSNAEFRVEDSSRVAVKVKRVTLPNVRPCSRWERVVRGFTIPQDCATSMCVNQCSFAAVRFFIRLKISRWPKTSYSANVEVAIGTDSNVVFNLNSSLQVHNVG